MNHVWLSAKKHMNNEQVNKQKKHRCLKTNVLFQKQRTKFLEKEETCSFATWCSRVYCLILCGRHEIYIASKILRYWILWQWENYEIICSSFLYFLMIFRIIFYYYFLYYFFFSFWSLGHVATRSGIFCVPVCITCLIFLVKFK